jgi:asparagine synthase (glutamine-hydrolysing)
MAGHLMTQAGEGPLATFSGVFDEVPKSNERRFIEAINRECGFSPSFLAADTCNPYQVPPELARTQAEVNIAPNMFVNWGLYSQAQQRGVNVMLDGFDGDTTISHGATYLSELARASRWIKLGQLAPALAAVSGRSALSVFWSYLWEAGLWPRLPALAQRGCRSVARRWRSARGAGAGPCCVLNSKFAERLGVGQYRASLRESSSPSARTERMFHYQNLNWGVMPATLEMLEQTAAPFGLEVRFPFWDKRLIEFCLGMPPEYKIREGRTRWILRQAMEGLLPQEIQWRAGKSNLGHGFKHCLIKHGMREMNEGDVAANSYLQAYVCSKHLDDSRRGFREKGGERETLFLWQVTNLTLWLKRTGLTA